MNLKNLIRSVPATEHAKWDVRLITVRYDKCQCCGTKKTEAVEKSRFKADALNCACHAKKRRQSAIRYLTWICEETLSWFQVDREKKQITGIIEKPAITGCYLCDYCREHSMFAKMIVKKESRM